MGWGKIAGSIILSVIGIVLSGLSYSIINQCNSFGGQLGTFLDTSNQQVCAMGSFLVFVGIFLTIIGIVFIILGSVSKKEKSRNRDVVRQQSGTKSFCRFCGNSILQCRAFETL
jgi:uncharacterized membrane protein